MSSCYYPVLCLWQWSGVSQRLAVVARGAGQGRWLSEVLLLGAEAARPRNEPQPFGQRSAEAANSALFTGWSLYCTIGLKTRRCGNRLWASDWLYYHANIVPKLRFTHHCQLLCFIPHLFLSSSICDQFVRFMCHKLVYVLKTACLCVSPCRFGCWRTDWAPGFLRFLSVEAGDKGKCEVRRGLNVLTAVCRVDGSRWMFEHQTDIKKQMAFMSSKIYPLNKHCRAPPGWIYGTWHMKRAQFRRLAEVRDTFPQRKHEILALF